MIKLTLMLTTLLVSLSTMAEKPKHNILLSTDLLQAAGLADDPTVTYMIEPQMGLAIAEVTDDQVLKVQNKAHDFGRCGGFELLEAEDSIEAHAPTFKTLGQLEYSNAWFKTVSYLFSPDVNPENDQITKAVNEVSADNIKKTIAWLSSFKSRYHGVSTRNDHVIEMRDKLQQMLETSKLQGQVDLIQHSNTQQNSIRVHLEGKSRPNEIVALGGHLDSISGWFGKNPAPGADDNASGSSNLVEALRVILAQGQQPERSVEFFWYAAEEVGLVGSAEIAKAYKAENADVIAVLQLDMTLFPGDGIFTLGSMTDFTSSWLRRILADLNDLYIGANIVESECGYGCSDHASWHRQGYPTLMPFESTMDSMNRRIHTEEDVTSSRTSFEHSAMFSKIAVAFAMELANSTARQPY